MTPKLGYLLFYIALCFLGENVWWLRRIVSVPLSVLIAAAEQFDNFLKVVKFSQHKSSNTTTIGSILHGFNA